MATLTFKYPVKINGTDTRSSRKRITANTGTYMFTF